MISIFIKKKYSIQIQLIHIKYKNKFNTNQTILSKYHPTKQNVKIFK
jgi:hypothetical protein